MSGPNEDSVEGTVPHVERWLAAILSADVKGYSRLMGNNDVATIETLTAYREVLTQLVGEQRGRVVDAPGDEILAEFPSVVDAVRSSVSIQEALEVRNAGVPVDRRMEFRIGVNLGEVIIEGDRIYGDGVNIAARIQALAEGGGDAFHYYPPALRELSVKLGLESFRESEIWEQAPIIRRSVHAAEVLRRILDGRRRSDERGEGSQVFLVS
jgi:hypothetical protein